jgi:hypothetical protein
MGASRSGNCRAQAIDPRRRPVGLREYAFQQEVDFQASRRPEWGDTLLTEAMNDEARALRLSAWIRGLAQAPAQDHGGVELIPLRIGRAARTRDLLLREALSAGVLEIRERRAGADEVEAVNRGGEAVLILEGQPLPVLDPERVAAGSILVPPLAVVSVVTGHAAPRRSRVRAQDPGRGQDGPASQSPAAVVGHSESLGLVRGQVGIVALSRGRLLGLEVAGHPAAWRALAPWAVRGWVGAAEAVEAGPDPRAAASTVEPGAWLDALASARVTTRPSRGLGREMTIRGDGFEGEALWHEGRPLHLVAHAV